MSEAFEDELLGIVNNARGLAAFPIHNEAELATDLQSTIAALKDLSRRGLIRFKAGLYWPMGDALPAPKPPKSFALTSAAPVAQQEETVKPKSGQQPSTQDTILANLPGTVAELVKSTKLSKPAIYTAASQMKKAGLIHKAGGQYVAGAGGGKPVAKDKPAKAPRAAAPQTDHLLPLTGIVAQLRAQRDKIDAAITALEAL